jgi:hypothetical protein
MKLKRHVSLDVRIAISGMTQLKNVNVLNLLHLNLMGNVLHVICHSNGQMSSKPVKLERTNLALLLRQLSP